MQRRGSVAVARDLERGEEMQSGSISFGRLGSVATHDLDTVSEVSITKDTSVRVREQEVRGDGLDAVDYGTIDRATPAQGWRTRPGYVRQDSNISFFKEPEW